MPKIDKIKKATKAVAKPTKKLTNLPTPRKNTPQYYQCLLTSAQANWLDPTTGQKKKITACCKECKTKAPVLNQQREQELQKLITAYQQVGNSLRKLLQPLK